MTENPLSQAGGEPDPFDPLEAPRSQAGIGVAVRKGALWGAVAQVVQQLLSVLATLVLVRIFTPEQFGVVAAGSTLMGLANVGLALGWAPSVVRRPVLTPEFLSTLFWTAVLTAAVLSAPLLLLAHPIAGVLGVPESAGYLRMLVPVVVLQIASTVPSALLTRSYRYGTYYAVTCAGMVVYVVVQIGLAVLGIGVMAVAFGQLAMSGFLVAASMFASAWVPHLTWRRGLIRGEIGFAGGVLTNQVFGYGVRNVDYMLVGGLLGAKQLGAYYLAFVLPSIIRLRMTNVARRLLLPVFARAQDDLQRRREVYQRVVRIQAVLGAPVMLFVAVAAGPIVEVAFGSKWQPAVAPMRWIAAVALLDLLGSTLAPVVLATAAMRRATAALVVRLGMTAGGVWVAVHFVGTLQSVAVAVLVATVTWILLQQRTVAVPLGLGFSLVRRDVFAVAVTTLVGGGLLVLTAFALEAVGAPDLLVLAVLGMLGLFGTLALGRWAFPDVYGPALRSILNWPETRSLLPSRWRRRPAESTPTRD